MAKWKIFCQRVIGGKSLEELYHILSIFCHLIGVSMSAPHIVVLLDEMYICMFVHLFVPHIIGVHRTSIHPSTKNWKFLASSVKSKFKTMVHAQSSMATTKLETDLPLHWLQWWGVPHRIKVISFVNAIKAYTSAWLTVTGLNSIMDRHQPVSSIATPIWAIEHG